VAYDDRDDSGSEEDPAVAAARRARGDVVCEKCGLLVMWDEDVCTSCATPRPTAAQAATDAPKGSIGAAPEQSVGMPRFLGSVIAGIICIGFSRLFGPVTLIPMAAVLVAWVLVHFVVPASAKPVREAIVLQTALLLCSLVGLIALRRFDLSWLEMMAAISVTAWLALRPGWVPIALLATYQIGMMIWIGVISSGKLDPVVEKGLALNLVLRLAVVGAMFLGLWRLRARAVHAGESSDRASTKRPTSSAPSAT